MTVPTGSSPRLPARPAICVYSPLSRFLHPKALFSLTGQNMKPYVEAHISGASTRELIHSCVPWLVEASSL